MLYPGLSLENAIAKAAKEGKQVMSPVTQGRYLDTLRDVLELGVLKRLLPNNPARGLRPLRRDDVRAEDKRIPFTLDQITTFFQSDFYQSCHPAAVKPYTKKDRDWRFWLPLLSLFMGMRPIEVCQMLPSDVKQSAKGTWYVDVVTSSDEDESEVSSGPTKTLKTVTSRRKIPVHPELLALGFADFALRQQKRKAERLFNDLKPDKYGNMATYALKRFRDTFLRDAIKLEPRQTFYSFMDCGVARLAQGMEQIGGFLRDDPFIGQTPQRFLEALSLIAIGGVMGSNQASPSVRHIAAASRLQSTGRRGNTVPPVHPASPAAHHGCPKSRSSLAPSPLGPIMLRHPISQK